MKKLTVTLHKLKSRSNVGTMHRAMTVPNRKNKLVKKAEKRDYVKGDV
jgi:hypothetical protein